MVGWVRGRRLLPPTHDLPSVLGLPGDRLFVPFFGIVSGVQLLTAAGTRATVLYYRDSDRESTQWRHDA